MPVHNMVRRLKKRWWRTRSKMDYNKLLADIHQIPLDRKGISENLDRLLKHAKYLE